ncbi:MAG: NfeD family protein [Oscillospiraceae bacterium]|nr:NfeD family protein [Oscillospiraceae bacterium]
MPLQFELGWLWLLALVFFIILEAATVQMVAIWFMIGSVAAFVCSLLGLGIGWEIAVFIVVSGLSLVMLRPLIKKRVEAERIPTNADMVIGRVGVVSEEINNDEGKGRVRVMNLDWAAQALDGERIKKNAKVNVHAIDGVKLIVVPLKEEN